MYTKTSKKNLNLSLITLSLLFVFCLLFTSLVPIIWPPVASAAGEEYLIYAPLDDPGKTAVGKAFEVASTSDPALFQTYVVGRGGIWKNFSSPKHLMPFFYDQNQTEKSQNQTWISSGDYVYTANYYCTKDSGTYSNAEHDSLIKANPRWKKVFKTYYKVSLPMVVKNVGSTPAGYANESPDSHEFTPLSNGRGNAGSAVDQKGKKISLTSNEMQQCLPFQFLNPTDQILFYSKGATGWDGIDNLVKSDDNPKGKGGAAGGGAAAGPDASTLTDCDVQLNSPLSWILCPLINLGSNVTDLIFQDAVKPLLRDVPIELKKDDPSYKAWQSFRFLANVMLVGSMLAIVYAQAKGEK